MYLRTLNVHANLKQCHVIQYHIWPWRDNADRKQYHNFLSKHFTGTEPNGNYVKLCKAAYNILAL